MKIKFNSAFSLGMLGVLALFFGTANNLLHLPFVIIIYPAVLYLLSQKANSGKQAFSYGWLTGGFGVSFAMYWLAVPVHDYGGFPWVLAIPVPFCMGFYIGFYGGLFSYFMYKAKALPLWQKIIFVGALWYVLEWVRSWFGTGITWLSLSAGNAEWPVLVQGASVVGMFGLSAVFAMIACFCVQKGKVYKVVTVLLLAVFVILGFMRMQQSIYSNAYARMLLVQGNLSQDVKWGKDMQDATLAKYLKLSEEGILKEELNKINMLVFPETSMPFFVEDKPQYQKNLMDFALKHDISLLFGGVSYTRERNSGRGSSIYNSLFLVPAKAESFSEMQKYDKQHLVPFGEYVPFFLDFKIFASLLQNIGGFTKGKDQKALNWGENKKLGILICYEAIFPEIARQSVADGAELLINISNDAWYNHTSAARQHLHLSLMRAIEQKRYLARATNTGITAFISPYGQVISETALFEDTSLAGTVGFINTHTVYFFIQPYLSVIMSLIVLYFLCIVFVPWKTKQNKVV